LQRLWDGGIEVVLRFVALHHKPQRFAVGDISGSGELCTTRWILNLIDSNRCKLVRGRRFRTRLTCDIGGRAKWRRTRIRIRWTNYQCRDGRDDDRKDPAYHRRNHGGSDHWMFPDRLFVLRRPLRSLAHVQGGYRSRSRDILTIRMLDHR
jgi:hypothetical protein